MNLDTFNNRYKIIGQIGKGAFGTVYLAISKNTGTKVAVKVVPITSSNEDKILREVVALENLSRPVCNPYVICYYDHFIDRNTNEMVIEMEYVQGPTVLNYTQILRDTNNIPLLNLTGRRLLEAMLLALKYVHGRNIIHNDIKPSNIVVSDTKIPILVDFGISCFATDMCPEKCCRESSGTSLYLPPESIKGVRYPSSDLWSLGSTVYTLVTGNNIWSINISQNPINLTRQVFDKFKNRVLPNKLNTDDMILNNIVNGFLVYNIHDRMSIDQALGMLGH